MAVATEQTKPILSKVVGVRLDRLVRNFMACMAKLDPAQGASPERMQAPVLITLKSEVKSCVDIRLPNMMPNAPQPPNKITISKDRPQGKNNHVKPLFSGKKPNTHSLSAETNINAKADKATLALVIKEGIRAFSRVKNFKQYVGKHARGCSVYQARLTTQNGKFLPNEKPLRNPLTGPGRGFLALGCSDLLFRNC